MTLLIVGVDSTVKHSTTHWKHTVFLCSKHTMMINVYCVVPCAFGRCVCVRPIRCMALERTAGANATETSFLHLPRACPYTRTVDVA